MDRRVMVMAAAALCLAAACSGSGDGARRKTLIETVEAYRAAKHDGDVEAMRALLSPDARIWFGKKEGEGAPIKPEGGPWSAWDRFFNATSEVVDHYEATDSTVSVTIRETNDYYRLLDRPGSRYRATYSFDHEGRITGIVIDASGQKRDPGRYDEFAAWAREHRPGLIEQLMPDGRMDPSLEKAKLWKRALVEWRAEAGLPPVETSSH